MQLKYKQHFSALCTKNRLFDFLLAIVHPNIVHVKIDSIYFFENFVCSTLSCIDNLLKCADLPDYSLFARAATIYKFRKIFCKT